MSSKTYSKKFAAVEMVDNEYKETDMKTWVSRTIIMAVVVGVAFVLARLAVRGVINLLVGGTLFGGNFL